MTNHTSYKIALSEIDLLEQPSIILMLNQLRDLTCLPEPHFDLFYKAPLGRFLALSQHCSENLLADHINAVLKALKLRRSLILPPDADAESINRSKDMWTYAVFVAALMYNSIELIAQQVIIKEKNELRRWTPFDTPIPAKTYYRVLGKLKISKYASNTLLQNIFCTRCITWLYRDEEVFNAVVNCSHSPKQNSRIGQLIIKAHGVLDTREYGKIFKSAENDTSVDENTLSETATSSAPDITEQKTSQATQKSPINFDDWLAKAVHNKRYSHLMCETVDGYVVSDPEIFEEYCSNEDTSDSKHVRSVFLANTHHTIGQKMKFSGGPLKETIIIQGLIKP